ncbi:transcriptional regulator with XRE-family HTH domain [Pedobacter africanus]|uniref:Transcriptional regulator with XRE-family HTH domain n=1 Tax=Pedobacter africanus TaxID=151894 RepID=A0ACC6KVP4_9SPHI|nr:hypothetical protein [Pedobacter africanus]MDR6783312.1 transcriptional regulator with XRE-family HTH domain [Pedobacter africanus]
MELQFMKHTPGEKLTMLRQKARRSKAETAGLLNLTLHVYVALEEDFLYPSDMMFHKIAKLYGITYDQLLAVGEPP